MTPRQDDLDPSGQPQRLLKIALVDDHELLLAGLVQVLGEKQGISKVVGYQNPTKIIDDLRNGHDYDLVISDLIMGEVDGLTFAHELQDQFLTPVLLITGVEAPPSRSDLAHRGIMGFVHKSAPIEVLCEAIHAVSSGETYFQFPDGWDPEASPPKFGRQPVRKSERPRDIALSQRQIEVLKLVEAGAANKEIASTLEITENTVKTHMKQIFAALGVTKRTACVQAAKSRGILE